MPVFSLPHRVFVPLFFLANVHEVYTYHNNERRCLPWLKILQFHGVTIHFNPWTGCRKVSPGCKFCYAERHVNRFGDFGARVKTSEETWAKPLKWNRDAENRKPKCPSCGSLELDHHVKARSYVCMDCQTESGERDCEYRPRVFCASLADVFEAHHGHILDSGGDIIFRPYLESENTREFWTSSDPETCRRDPQGWSPITMHDLRRELFKLIDMTPNIDWLLLTKRPENIQKMWLHPSGGYISLTSFRKNVWLGTSVENSDQLNRIDALKCSGDLAANLFLSCEPLLGPLPTLGEHLDGIDWVIAGGESGPGARPMDLEWVRSIRDQCETYGVPFHFKQWGEWIPYEFTGSPPLVESQHGDNIDSHHLPVGLTDHEPIKGWWWPDGLSQTIYRKVCKKKSGRLLDGVMHNSFPDSY